MCEDMLKGTGTEVFKCGAPIDHNLSLDIDQVRHQELISYDLIGFENYGKAMATIFQVVTLEGWAEMTYNYSDAESPVIAFFFFGLLVVFCAFFALNLVLAQIMDAFYKEKDENSL